MKKVELVEENIIDAGETEKGVELLTGDTAMQFIQQPEFLGKWQELYEFCAWSTAFQSPGFVNTWYHSFEKDYYPVVVMQTEGRDLVGLLCMAIPYSGKPIKERVSQAHKIVGAGEFESEYQVWLSRFNDGKFISEAIQILQRNFPKGNIQFRFIPSQAPMDWLLGSELRHDCVFERHKRPLLVYGSKDAKNAFKISRQYKTKLNRLKRTGEVVFERVKNESEFAQILEELAVHFDFRQGGMFNKNQFREHPARKNFLLGLFREKVLHVTILRVDCQIIAAVGAVYGKKWLHLQGLNTHSPFVARHSPGILHFLHLGKYLEEEGFSVFDLTPGGDGYKEKFATSHDEVYCLHISQNPFFKTKKILKKRFHQYLVNKNIQPMGLELKVEKEIYEAKHNLRIIKNSFLRFAISPTNQKINWQKVIEAPNRAFTIEKNNLNDLLDFSDSNNWLSRWNFLNKAMSAFEKGHSVYTWSRNGKLLAAVWAVDSQDKAAKGYPDGFTLQDPYVHPEGRDVFYSFLKAVVQKIQENHPNRPVQAAS